MATALSPASRDSYGALGDSAGSHPDLPADDSSDTLAVDSLEDRRAKMNVLFGFKPWSVRISKPNAPNAPLDASEGMAFVFDAHHWI